MKFRDSGLHFGFITVISHWLGALSITVFCFAAILELVTDDANGIFRSLTLMTGIITAPLFGFRIIWRITNYYPAPLGGANPAQVLIGRGIAFGMLLAGIILPCLYWLKEVLLPMSSWWLTPLFWTGMICCLSGLALHLYAAYSHQFILKDQSLLRLMGKRIDM